MNTGVDDHEPLADWRDEISLASQSYPLSQQILRTDVSGMPLEWVDYREAARLYHTEQVAYTCGTQLYRLYGGTSARTGLRTIVDVNSIIATLGVTGNPGNLRGATYTPPLNNQTLFRRVRVSATASCRATTSRPSAAAARIPGGMSSRPAAAATTRKPRVLRSRRACSCLPCRSRRPMRSTSISRAGACSPIKWNI